ncbi:MAG TPA: hypothetical protein VIM73_11050, partial [Polyangiaceae bacterium]
MRALTRSASVLGWRSVLATLLLSLSGSCKRNSAEEQRPAPSNAPTATASPVRSGSDPPAAPTASHATPRKVERKEKAMGTSVHLVAYTT